MLPQADNSWTILEAAHLLNRAGFGGAPDAIRKLHALGRKKAVESLLSPSEQVDEMPPPAWAAPEQMAADQAERVEKRRAQRREAREMSAEEGAKARREFQRSIQRENRRRTFEAQGWWFGRIVRSQAPLREKMTLFWHDHFSTSVQKVKSPALMVQQNQLFRRGAFGSFKDLTESVLLDPAMMIYLDTQGSRKGKPNENFAREVMELFTLGEGNYTEQDIHEAARAFTGYQINRMNGTVRHNRRQWDTSDKTVFGVTGPHDGKDVIRLIFGKKEVSGFLAGKLWEFFVNESPAKETVRALATTLRNSNFETAPVLREIFLSKEFYSEPAMRTQIKCPIQFLATLLNQLEVNDPPAGFSLAAQQQLGQTLFMPPNVAGWDWGKAWINTNTLLTRYNLAGFITKGAGRSDKEMNSSGMRMVAMKRAVNRKARAWSGPDYEKIVPRPIRENPEDLVDALISRFFQGPVPAKARATFVEYAVAKKGVIFTNTETAELCHLMLSTPYYQLH